MASRALSLGADAPPAGFAFPTEGQYLQGLVQAVGTMAPAASAKPGSSNDVLSPPVRAQVTGLIVALEASTGVPLDELIGMAGSVQSLVTATNAPAAVNAVRDLLNGTLALTTTVAEAAGAAAEVLDVVPVLGRIIGFVLGGLADILGAEQRYAAAAAECQRGVDKEMDTRCAQLLSAATPRATGAEGVTPADMFRPVAYAWQAHDALLPLTPASIYVALCASETQGWLSGSEPWLQKNSIPTATKRKMWALCKGIMASIQRPGITDNPGMQTDQGRSLFPLLQDMVRNLYVQGVLNDVLLRKTASGIAAARRLYRECPISDVGAGAMPTGAASCSDRVDLFTPFQSGLDIYQARLIDEFWRNGHWTTDPAHRIVSGHVNGVLDLDVNQSSSLLQSSQAIFDAILKEGHYPSYRELRLWQQGLLALGVAGAGYLGYHLVGKVWA